MTEWLSAAVGHPVFGLVLTLVAFQWGLWVYQLSGRHVLVQPFIVACIPVLLVLHVTHMDFRDYSRGTAVLHALLGPATVALAVPLFRHVGIIARHAVALLFTVVVGALVAVASAGLLAFLCGADGVTFMSVLPKTVTTPIAMQVASLIGGLPQIAAGTVALTGVVGAICGPWLFDRLGIHDERVRGLALGLAAHAVGTARAFDESPRTGAFASLGLGLTGLFVALLLPFVVRTTGLSGLFPH